MSFNIKHITNKCHLSERKTIWNRLKRKYLAFSNKNQVDAPYPLYLEDSIIMGVSHTHTSECKIA